MDGKRGTAAEADDIDDLIALFPVLTEIFVHLVDARAPPRAEESAKHMTELAEPGANTLHVLDAVTGIELFESDDVGIVDVVVLVFIPGAVERVQSHKHLPVGPALLCRLRPETRRRSRTILFRQSPQSNTRLSLWISSGSSRYPKISVKRQLGSPLTREVSRAS